MCPAWMSRQIGSTSARSLIRTKRDTPAVLDPRRARHDRADHRVERVELVHLQERRARVQPVEADMGRVEAQFLVIGLAEEGGAADAGPGRPDHLDGAAVGIGGVRRKLRRPAHGRQFDHRVHGVSPVGRPAPGHWPRRRCEVRHRPDRSSGRWPRSLDLRAAGLGDAPRIAVEHQPQRVELGVGRGDLGQHGVGVAALPGDHLGQRHGAGADRQQVRHRVLLRIDRLELRRRPFDRHDGRRDLASRPRSLREPAPDRRAEHRDEELPLHRVDLAAELHEPRPDRGIVHLGLRSPVSSS